MDFRAFARRAAEDQHGEPYLEHGPDEALFEPSACAYCGSEEFEPQEDNGRVNRATCAECGGSMVSHGGAWMPDLIGSPHNHPSDKPDPASGGVPGAGAAPEQVRDNDLSKRTAMPSRKHTPPAGLEIRHQQFEPGRAAHEEMESERPGWGHHALHGYLDGAPVARVEYSSNDTTVKIHNMRTETGSRGQGIASALQDRLRSMHPGHMFDHGSRTDAGQGWWDQYSDPGDPKLDLDHPDNAHAWPQHVAAADWCRHRHAEHCWLPRVGAPLHVPQDRGACPWTTASMQQINCPVSEPGPMAGMTRAGALQVTAAEVGNIPVKHAGFAGFVEPSAGHHEKIEAMDREFFGDSPEYREPHPDAAPVGHHGALINFITQHHDNSALWRSHGRVEKVDHRQPIYATQPYVTEHHIARQAAPGEHPAPPPDNGDDHVGHEHPMFVRHEGALFTVDGHHRTSRRLMARAGHEPGWVYDADRHGFPESEEHHPVVQPGMHRYAGIRPVPECDFPHEDPEQAAAHALYNHDDGICVATEGRRARQEDTGMTRESSWTEPEWRFHVLATWADVRRKAKGIRSEGGVAIISSLVDGVTGHVNGDTGVYETQINYVPGTFKVGYWQCGCAWASYAWGRSPAFRRFEGRMCSHALALQYEAQARGMFGRQVVEDTERPGWMRDKIRVRHDRVTRDHDVREAARRTDPDGVYPEGHGLDLERSPIHAFATEAHDRAGDPADVMAVYLAAGIEHGDARRLLDATLHGRAVMDVQVIAYYDENDHDDWGGEHGEHHESGTDWDDVHSGIEELHRGVGVMLHPDDHAIVHDKSRPVEERAHHLLKVMQRHPSEPGIGTHWTTEHRVADDFADGVLTRQLTSQSKHEYMQRGDHRWGHDRDGEPKGQPATSVMFHAHPPERHEIDDNPSEMEHGSSSIYGYHDHGEREVPIRPGGTVALKGISWKEKHDDFDEPDDHDDSYTHHAFGGEGHHVTAKKDEAPSEPTHAGVVLKAADTGRVLMIQRSHHDESDPAAGTWEFPGGGREPHDHNSLMSGVREFEEEVGHEFPTGGHVQHVWQSPNGVYQGHVVVIPHEHAIDFSKGRSTVNPDDPDGDDHEQSAWWDPDHARKNPALRPECKSSPWSMIKAASLPGVTADYSSDGSLNELQPDYRPKNPPLPPDANQAQNPGSTGFATGGDPPEWENAAERAETMSLTPAFAAAVAEVHDRHEPALPSTTAEDEDDTLAYVEPPGERFRSQMRSEIPSTESLSPNDGRTASIGGVSDIVERFQATAAAQALQTTGGPAAMDIASAARDHLARAQGGGIQRTALKEFNAMEQAELIGEGHGARARNFGDLKIAGTHYEALGEALAHEKSLADPDELFD